MLRESHAWTIGSSELRRSLTFRQFYLCMSPYARYFLRVANSISHWDTEHDQYNFRLQTLDIALDVGATHCSFTFTHFRGLPSSLATMP